MPNQCLCTHYRRHLPHTLDKAQIVSASGPVCFLMIYMCNIFAMLLLDFPHALLLETSKLISYMFPINALYGSCSWLFSLCLSCVVLLKVRQSKNYLKGERKKSGFFLKSEYLKNNLEKLQKTKILHMQMQWPSRVLSHVLPCIKLLTNYQKLDQNIISIFYNCQMQRALKSRVLFNIVKRL